MRVALVLCCLATVFVTLPAANGQGSLFVPDNMANAGTCNTIPFSQTAYTYAGRIPASFLDPNQRSIDDLAFAPCGTATFTAPTIRMGIGHIPANLATMTFPTFDAAGVATSTGSFLDYHSLWNSNVQGTFSYPYVLDTWSPLGFAATGGTGFVWDGINDVAWFITFSGATGGNSFHRSTTEPFRYYATTYQAPSSTGTGAAGAKVRVDVRQHGNILALSQSGPGIGDLQVSLTLISPTAVSGFTLLSTDVSGALALGPVLGIRPSQLTWDIFGYPYFPGNPFHFQTQDPAPLFPAAPLYVPPGTMTSLTGVTLDAVCLLLNLAGGYDARSNVVRYTFL